MNRRPTRAISQDEIETFARDGVVHLKNMFDPGWVEHLRAQAEQDMSTPGELKHELAESGDTGRFFNHTFLWPRNTDFKSYVFESPAAELAGTIMASSRINIVFDQLLIKEPNTQQRTVWHQDLTYWPIYGQHVCTLWLALDPVSADTGAVEFVKGSHAWGQRYGPIAFRPDLEYAKDLPPVPDIESMRDEIEILQFEFAPGDCTIHHGMMVHGAPGNASDTLRRRAHVTRWAGDGVVYDPRPGIQPMLWEPTIAPGAALDCDLWPEIWRRQPEP